MKMGILRSGVIFAGSLIAVAVSADPIQSPIFLVQSTEPLVMINMSNDHELYFKAYDDYSDVDGGGPDTTYKHTIDYYGYFDSETCYSYTSGEFVPQAKSTDKYCNGVTGDWSGNFLNWATMARMDTIRKTLYGGYRSTDTADKTVLERTFLPTDAHSFAKYYAGSDLSWLTPYSGDLSMCNTTQASTGNSRDVSEPPLMRVATGNYSMWSSHDGAQCQWYDENDTPNTNDPDVTGIDASNDPPDNDDPGTDEYIVRVEVCASEALAEENCRLYPDGNRKPIGLLQEHGEDGSVHFGLMTGSYAKNKSGGVLRKNVSSFANEVNEGSDGTFVAAPAGGGIVDTLNKLRLTNYSYDDPRGYNDLDNCDFAKFGFPDGECSNWGNPQSEIYLESLRYLAGKSADFDADDSTYINGLGRASWTDPLSNSNYCAPISIIHFNASTSSFDGDQLSGFSDLPGSPSEDTWTNRVGNGEGINTDGANFVGQIPSSTDKSCTAKDLVNLSDASGICPEAPWLEGTYQIAGLAYFANQNSIRTDLDDSDGQEADVRVKTYGVALSPAQPIINIPVPGTTDQEVILLPACMEFRVDASYPTGTRHNGNCAMVDFRIVEPHTESGGKGAGKFLVLWESAQFGGDYDHDMAGVISYVIYSTHIEVTTEVYGAFTGGIHGFGYVISGTTQDGLHIHSGHNKFDDYADPYNADPGLLVKLNDCTADPCNAGDGPTTNSYTIGTTRAMPLQTPLYYAAKWGGFVEDDTDPDDVDNVPDQDYEWDANADGLPDNYFLARNPGQLSGQLASVFETIGQTSSASAVVANSVSFQSTTRIYQARFNSFDWTGQLLSFPLRVSDGAVLDPEWDAGCVLTGGACLATGTTETGQDYDTAREILTWDGDADAGVPFRWDNSDGLNATQEGLLSVGGDATLGENRLNYLRGDRSLERPDGLFRARKSLLGDNVNSSPAVVGMPNFSYVDTLESTATGNNPPNNLYSTFVLANDDVECFDLNGTLRTSSWEREPMVYFGANDGMLHGVSACTGEERIAYVPNALMAQLPLLTNPTYSHRYFVDGSPTIVDAFWSSAWHTVLVGTTRAGGKAVFALDVTDPSVFDESNADDIVLWEISNTDTGFSDLGYTFSQPAVVKAKGYDTWVAVFGNGYDSVDGKAVLYVVDIETGTRQEAIVLDSGTGNGLSTVAPVDTDNDGEVDVIYAGDLKGNLWRIEAGNNGFSTSGVSLLYAAKADSTTAQPITTRPEVGRHPLKHDGRMVYFGTGKYYEAEDGDPGNAVANSMYGIFDDDSGATVPSVTDHTASNVLQRQLITTLTGQTFGTNTFDIRVLTDQAVTWITEGLNTCGDSNPDADTDNNTDDDYLQCGWYVDLPVTGEKMVSNPLLRGGRLIFVTTIPSTASCDAGGDSWLMEIAADNGGEINHPVFDLNGDGVFDYNDMRTTGDSDDPYQSISGKKSKVGILQPPAIVAGVGGAGTGGYGKAEAKYSSGSKGGEIEVTIEDVGLPSGGRKSWIQFK